MIPEPIVTPERCWLTIALTRAAQVIKKSAQINSVVTGSRPMAMMGVERAARIGGEKKNQATGKAMHKPIRMRQSGAERCRRAGPIGSGVFCVFTESVFPCCVHYFSSFCLVSEKAVLTRV